MKIAITGIGGFLGRTLRERLLASGHEVTGFDQIGIPCGFPVGRDICDPRLFPEKPEVVFHFAGASDPRWCETNRYSTVRHNVLGTENVLEQAHECGARVVLATTSAVIDSRCDTTLYATSKACCEYLALYWRKQGLKIVLARYWNVYGPGQAKHALIPRFLETAMAGKPLEVFEGDVNNRRDFVHVDDVHDFHEWLLKAPDWNNEYEIGTNIRTSVSEVAALVQRLTLCPFSLLRPNPPGFVATKPASVIDPPPDWKPKIDLETGIKRLIIGAWRKKTSPTVMRLNTQPGS